MPIYEYDCPKCGVVEVTQRITAPVLTKCPNCKRKVQKLISASAFQFKGEGWYVTDYARKGKGKNGDGAGKTDGGSGGSADADAKGESKAETKSESKAEGSKASGSTSGSSTKPAT